LGPGLPPHAPLSPNCPSPQGNPCRRPFLPGRALGICCRRPFSCPLGKNAPPNGPPAPPPLCGSFQGPPPPVVVGRRFGPGLRKAGNIGTPNLGPSVAGAILFSSKLVSPISNWVAVPGLSSSRKFSRGRSPSAHLLLSPCASCSRPHFNPVAELKPVSSRNSGPPIMKGLKTNPPPFRRKHERETPP